ncbi:MAG TPA: hypothetical protein VF834_20880 [Streptosporangiaceae bacterium]
MHHVTATGRRFFHRLAIVTTLATALAVPLVGAAPANAVPYCWNTATNGHYVWNTETWPGDADWSVQAWGPGTLSMTRTETIANSFSSSYTVSADAVSATVGFSVTQTYSVGTSYSISVPANQKWQISAGYVSLTYQFDVYRECTGPSSMTYLGHGWADKYHNLVYMSFRLV